jgi:hypothetical protein
VGVYVDDLLITWRKGAVRVQFMPSTYAAKAEAKERK